MVVASVGDTLAESDVQWELSGQKNVWLWAAADELLCAQRPVQSAACRCRSRDPAKPEACCFAHGAPMDRKEVVLRQKRSC